MIDLSPSTDTADGWLPAGPFRALARHLMNAGPVEAADLAAITGLSPLLVQHLVYGRSGRPVRRISHDAGSCLMELSVDRLRDLRRRSAPPSVARRKLAMLRTAGWTSREILTALGGGADGQALAAVSGGRCSELMLLRLRALCRELEPEPDRQVAAA